MALARRYPCVTTINVRMTLRHDGSAELEAVQNYITRRICGFKNEDDDDPWILENPTISEEVSDASSATD